MTHKNFSFRVEWVEAMDGLDEDEVFEILRAMAHFAKTGEILELTYFADRVFQYHMVPTLLKRRKAAQYRARAKARRQAAAQKSDESKDKDEKPAVAKVTPTPDVEADPQAPIVEVTDGKNPMLPLPEG
ncbi:MAG: hypothetical protein HDT06_02430 [Bacteroidales bacterium]|nr:hypothetical protein [Bacteroidales bacterium]